MSIQGSYPTTSQKFAHSPQQEKLPPLNFHLPPQPITKQQFSRYNPIKTIFLAVGIAPAPLFEFHTLLGSNRQNQSSSGPPPSPSTSYKFAQSPHQEELPQTRFLFPPQPPTKQ